MFRVLAAKKVAVFTYCSPTSRYGQLFAKYHNATKHCCVDDKSLLPVCATGSSISEVIVSTTSVKKLLIMSSANKQNKFTRFNRLVIADDMHTKLVKKQFQLLIHLFKHE